MYLHVSKANKMKTSVNRFGEEYTTWTSHKHPENPTFMQIVHWHVWVKGDKTTVIYTLGSGSKSNYVHGLTKDEAIAKFSDSAEVELTDADFEKWLSEHK